MERIKWTPQLIEEEIRNVMDVLDISRMPSNSEIKAVSGNSALINAVRRHGGFYGWAERIGIPVKDSETKTGDIYELYTMAIMKGRRLRAERMSVKHPYDLLVNGHIKVDVKVSKAYLNNGSLVNTVGLSKQFATCDIYMIYLLKTSGEIDRTLIIPGCEVRHKYLNIGKESKYNKYIDRWDYFEKYEKLREMLQG